MGVLSKGLIMKHWGEHGGKEGTRKKYKCSILVI